MTYLQFRQWVVDAVNRTDLIVTSVAIHRAIASARRAIQQRAILSGMESSFQYTLINGDDHIELTNIGLIKQEQIVRILDSDNNVIVILDKQPDIKVFKKLMTVDYAAVLLEQYRNLVVLFDTTGVEGYPLIYNIWAGKLQWFPPVSGGAVGKILDIQYYKYFTFDLSTLAAGTGPTQMDGYEDFLFDSLANVTYYRTLMELSPYTRNMNEYSIWKELDMGGMLTLVAEDIAKQESGTSTQCMGGR